MDPDPYATVSDPLCFQRQLQKPANRRPMSGRYDPIVFIDRPHAALVFLVPLIVGAVFRGATQLLLSDAVR
jgi:hypothetical protein